MFNKLKQFKDLRSEAKTLQNALAEEKVTVEKNDIKLTIDGNQKVLSISIPEGASSTELERNLPDLFNDGVGKVQRIVAGKMKSGELSMPDMSGLQ